MRITSAIGIICLGVLLVIYGVIVLCRFLDASVASIPTSAKGFYAVNADASRTISIDVPWNSNFTGNNFLTSPYYDQTTGFRFDGKSIVLVMNGRDAARLNLQAISNNTCKIDIVEQGIAGSPKEHVFFMTPDGLMKKSTPE